MKSSLKSPPKPPCILFVVNVDWFFISHRLQLALAAKKAGYDVHLALTVTNGMDILINSGFTVHPLEFKRGKANLFDELKTFLALLSLFRRLRPEILHLVTIKPVLYGGIAARLARISSVVAAISGLGYVFSATDSRSKFRRWLIGLLYKVALKHHFLNVIFQNEDDKKMLMHISRISEKQCKLIKGSGVDLFQYKVTSLPNGVPTVLMASRLLSDKGVWQYLDAADELKKRGYLLKFVLAGSIDEGNPSSLTVKDLELISRRGLIDLVGYSSDMSNLISAATIVVLPSFYAEGLPRVLIEAAACGRAVITTDMPGCRDAIDPGITGILVPPRDANALANAIAIMTQDLERCKNMGLAGRKKAESEFDQNQTIQQHLEIYNQSLSKIGF